MDKNNVNQEPAQAVESDQAHMESLEKAPGEMELLDQETIEKVVGGGIRINVKPRDWMGEAKDRPGSLGN